MKKFIFLKGIMDDMKYLRYNHKHGIAVGAFLWKSQCSDEILSGREIIMEFNGTLYDFFSGDIGVDIGVPVLEQITDNIASITYRCSDNLPEFNDKMYCIKYWVNAE